MLNEPDRRPFVEPHSSFAERQVSEMLSRFQGITTDHVETWIGRRMRPDSGLLPVQVKLPTPFHEQEFSAVLTEVPEFDINETLVMKVILHQKENRAALYERRLDHFTIVARRLLNPEKLLLVRLDFEPLGDDEERYDKIGLAALGISHTFEYKTVEHPVRKGSSVIVADSTYPAQLLKAPDFLFTKFIVKDGLLITDSPRKEPKIEAVDTNGDTIVAGSIDGFPLGDYSDEKDYLIDPKHPFILPASKYLTIPKVVAYV